MNLKNFLERIESQCNQKGKKRQNVYVDCGVGKDFGVSIRNGSEPSIGKVFAIANELDCSVDYLLERTDNPNSHKVNPSNTVNGNYNAVDNSSVMVNAPALDEHQKLLIELYNKLSPIEQVELIAKLNNVSK